MLYRYETFVTGPKLNKKKVFICAVIFIILCIAISYGIIMIIKNEKEKNADIQQIKIAEDLKRKEQEKIEEEKRKQEEEKRIKEEKLKETSFNEEQLNAIENIYLGEEKTAFLTFDDGPTQAVTPFILDVLKEKNVKATFFVLGNRAVANPEIIQREYDEEHYIANHGYTHIYSQIYQNSQTVLDEYNYTEECIQNALGNTNYHSKLFRFPGGSKGGYYSEIKDEAVEFLKENGIASLDWNALSRDAEGAKTTEELFDNVVLSVGEKQNVVILMHDASDKILTYEVLPDIIEYLKDNGYVFKTIYDII